MFYERSWSYGLLQKLRTYGGIWSRSVFDLSYWHQQLALICQIKPTVLLAEQYWPTSLRGHIPLLYPPSSPTVSHNWGHSTNWPFSTYLYYILWYNFPCCQIHFNSLYMSIIFTSCDGLSQSPQTAIKVSSAALTVISILSLRTITVLHGTLFNGCCSSMCHISFITWICKVVSFIINTHKILCQHSVSSWSHKIWDNLFRTHRYYRLVVEEVFRSSHQHIRTYMVLTGQGWNERL